MGRPTASPDRHVEILHAIVQTYIETGEPVASRDVCRRSHKNLSAASVRNVMADLSDEGYLSQPHTSAGRIPTEKAFRSYVQSLAANRILAKELRRLREELHSVETMQGRIERSSHLLTEMSHSVGIVAAIPNTRQTLSRVELVGLNEQRVLMVVVTSDELVCNKVVTLTERIRQDELDSIRNYVNWHFAGWTLEEIREDLGRRLQKESAAYDAILSKLTMLYDNGLLDVGLTPEIHLEGASNLVGLDLHLTRERMRDLFQTLEQKKRILQLLDRFLEQPAGELVVHVGLHDAYPSMAQLALIGISLPLPHGASARIAVLGPMRMNYEKAMSAVLHVGQAFQSLPV